MQSQIMNKHFFIKTEGGKAYCSKCGQLIMQDQRNMILHAQNCGFQSYDFVKLFQEVDEYAFAWKEMGDKLGFIVYAPELIRRPGFQDQYLGARWKVVYKCLFSLTEKRIWEDQHSMYSLDYWANQEMECLNQESTYEIINRVFHIPGIKDLKSFVNIYKGRGFRYKELMAEEEAREILNCNSNRGESFRRRVGMVPGLVGSIEAELIELKDKDELVFKLNVHLKRSNKMYQILVSEDYFFSNQPLDMKQLLVGKLYCKVRDEDVRKFAERYPRFGLINYWESSKDNLLIPLLSPIYDPGLELLSKSGCKAFANHYYEHREFETKGFEPCGDIRKWLGVPVKVLRRVHDDAFYEKELISILTCVYQVAPEYLTDMNISFDYVMFLKENILALIKRKDTGIYNFDSFNSKVCLRIARYISAFREIGISRYSYRLYVDYMNMSRHNGEYIMGYTPNNLYVAHGMALRRYHGKLTAEQEKLFAERVLSDAYKSLETSGADANLFQDSPFMIRAPKKSKELIREGDRMNHCVASYIERVMRGQTKIYFLRRKSDPNTEFATIEVSNSSVYQVKAKCNRKTTQEAQEFVKYWAKVKQLDISTRDIA